MSADMSSSPTAAASAKDRSRPQPSPGAPASGMFKGRLKVDQTFCPDEVTDPFDTVEWETRAAQIKGENGELLFEQDNCEVPTFWSQLATNVICSKYFYGEVDTPEREYSVRQLIHRVSRSITDWGIEDGYFATRQDGERFYRDLTWLCLHQHGAFNSPVWFNVGLHQMHGVTGDRCNWHWDVQTESVQQPENPYEFPQASACFIQQVDDNMEDIMRLATSEAMLFKFGSGTGTDLSTLRSHREKLSGGGKPSGPLSFMRVYDQIAAVVKSGGKTRRAAKMQSLKVWHPDIMEFIECKWKEEQKARVLIEKGGYESNFNGEAYSSIMFQNANLSVRVTDEFMKAVDHDKQWTTRWVTDGATEGPTFPAREILSRMADCAWHCGDPGVQYDTTINRWHTCPNSGRINASNPCSEYMFLDNTACNLASINLMKFRQEDGTFDCDRFVAASRVFFIAQEILVDHASYPTAEIAHNSHLFRPLGLGYSNLGSLLMSGGMPYDSDAARGVCGAITSLLHGAANLTSSELSEAVGTFDEFELNREPMLRVMEMHRSEVEKIDETCPTYLRTAARNLWDDVLLAGNAHGFRNAQATVLAPTGTISFMMDCDTTGIEPDIALVKYKQLAGRGMLKIVNRTVPLALQTLGYDETAIEGLLQHIEEHDTIEGCDLLHEEDLPIFDCAFTPRGGTRSINWRAHIRMMAAAQPFLSGAISKTVNMPRDTTTTEIADAYMDGWRYGLKALAIYRDGSKESQPLSTSKEGDRGEDANAVRVVAKPFRKRLPDTRQSVTHKFDVARHEGYVTVGLYDDGRPGELFITMAKEGSTIGGLMDAFGTSVSMSLQYGVPLEDYVRKFSHMRFEPQGFTSNPDIRIAKSLIDYIFRWLGLTFLSPETQQELGIQSNQASSSSEPSDSAEDAEAQPKPVATKVGGQDNRQDAKRVPSNGTGKAEAKLAGELKTIRVDQPASSNGVPAQKERSSNSGKQNGNASHASGSDPANGHANGSSATRRAPAPESASLLTARTDQAAISASLGESWMEAEAEQQFADFQLDAPTCDNCGHITVRAGNCYLCHVCGTSMGCS